MKIGYTIEMTKKKYDDEKAQVKEYGWENVNQTFVHGNVSDGINKMDMPVLYKKFLNKEIDSYGQFLNYADGDGSHLLIETIGLFERTIATRNIEQKGREFAKYLSITCGATAAIFLLFNYLKEKHNDFKVKMLGLQYYIFEENCKHCGFEYEYLVSKRKGFFLPNINEIKDELLKLNNNILILTIPCNPSGEIYTYDEVVEICKLCIETNSILVVDKCQLDIFSTCFEFVNIGKAIIEAGAENITYFIDGFSKLRSIPGARIGYLFSNDCDLNKYIFKCSELIYCCPSRGFDNAILMDMLIRTVYYMGEKKWISKFKRLIIMYSGFDKFKKIYGTVLSDPDEFKSVMMQFVSELQENSKTVWNNYMMTKELLYDNERINITNLQGGFNFCIFIKDKEKRGETDVVIQLTKLLNAKILPQSFFGGNNVQYKDGFWCRISAALKTENYLDLINRMQYALQKL